VKIKKNRENRQNRQNLRRGWKKKVHLELSLRELINILNIYKAGKFAKD